MCIVYNAHNSAKIDYGSAESSFMLQYAFGKKKLNLINDMLSACVSAERTIIHLTRF